MHSDSSEASHPRATAYVNWLLRHGWKLWAVAILLAIPATYRTVQLYMHLKSDFEALLPRTAPSVVAIDTLRQRTPGLQFLGVVVDTGDAEHLGDGEKFLDELAARVRAYPPELVRAVQLDNAAETRFIERNAPLYIDTPDLQSILDRLKERRRWEAMRGTFGSIDDEEEPPSVDFTDIRDKYIGSMPAQREGTRYSSKALHTTVMLVQVGGEFSTGNASGIALYNRIKADIADMGGASKYGATLTYGFSGDVATYFEETEALAEDLSVSSVLVVFAVIAVLVLYYRWWRSVIVLLPPLLLATVFAFGIASLPPFGVNALNSNTAFLGSIIIGNGINFGIVLLARYVEERRRNRSTRDALVTAVATSRAGTLAAALAASVAYGSLTITQFRGFRQFGTIGGMGMVLAWIFAFVLLPPLISWLDRSAKTAPKPRAVGTGIMARLANVVSLRFRSIAILSAVLTALAIIPVSRFGAGQIESDLSKLRRRDTWTSGQAFWAHKMSDVLQRYLTPMVVLTDDEDEARAVAKKLQSRLGDEPYKSLIGMVRSGNDLVPSEQPQKIELVKELRRLISPALRERLNDEQRRLIDQFLGNDELQPIGMDDVPETLKQALRERDGSLGKTVLVYPRLGAHLWDGPTLVNLVGSIRNDAKSAVPEGHRAQLAGSVPVSADIIEFMRRDGLTTSLTAFLGVVAVVLLLLRFHRMSWLVIGALAAGVLYLVAITVAFNIKVNFANFIAFPITFGIGVDYAVNVATRYVADGEDDVRGAVASTGGAVGLCSLTTIIGYASLLLAKNNALFLFGLLAVLGEITCLWVAVTVLPAVLLVLKRRVVKTRNGS